MREKILCAAVWYKDIENKLPFMGKESYLPKNLDIGVVFSGHRHGQCIYTKCAVTGLSDSESGDHVQGFLTSKNRFVTREEAFIIAKREGQIIDLSDTRGNKLYSEDLY